MVDGDTLGAMGLLLPPALGAGATLAVVATSWGGPARLPARFQRGVQALTALGYGVRAMPHALGERDGLRGWVSASAADRLSDLHAAFADPSVDGVLSAIGGDHSAE